MSTIDRSELRGVLYDAGVTGRLLDETEAAVLALVEPAAGITLTPEEARALVAPGEPDARMSAYYYGFERTGFASLDDILSAVATAGKHYHGTDQWADPDFDSEEPTEEEAIQAAANRGAFVLRALAQKLEASA